MNMLMPVEFVPAAVAAMTAVWRTRPPSLVIFVHILLQPALHTPHRSSGPIF